MLMSVGQQATSPARSIRRRVGVALVLALGIVFAVGSLSLAHSVLLRPLGIANPGTVVRLGETGAERAWMNPLAWPDVDLFSRSPAFSAVAAEAYAESVHWRLASGARVLATPRLVTSNYFSMLGVEAHLGRLLGPADETPSTSVPVVLAYDFWSRIHGGDASVLGTTVMATNQPVTIVGVASPQFRGLGLATVDMWMPAKATLPAKTWSNPQDQRFETFGRLAGGVSRTEADAMVDGMAKATTRAGRPWRAMAATVDRLGNTFRDQREVLTTKLLVAGGLAALLLTIANVTSLMVLWIRREEEAIQLRRMLGATSRKIASLLVRESVKICGIATAFSGVILAALWLVAARQPDTLNKLSVPALSDVLMLFCVICLSSIVLLCIYPLLVCTRVGMLRGQLSGTHATRSRRWLIAAVVSFQIALCMGLVAGATMMSARAFDEQGLSLGFDDEAVLSMALMFDERPKLVEEARYRRILDESSAVLGQEAVALAGVEPVASSTMSTTASVFGGEGIRGIFNPVTPSFFSVAGIPIVEGRAFTANDRSTDSIVILSKSAAEALFPATNAVGKEVTLDALKKPVQVVGVAGDVSYEQFGGDGEAAYYIPFEQRPWPGAAFLLVNADRATVDRPRVSMTLSQIVAGLEPNFAAVEPQQARRRYDAMIAPLRNASHLAVAFAVSALLLASVGVFLTTSFAVAEQRKDFAIRIAMGERPASAFNRIMKMGALYATLGAALGVLIAFAAGSLIEASFPQVPGLTGLQMSFALLTIFVVTLAACIAPGISVTRGNTAYLLRDS